MARLSDSLVYGVIRFLIAVANLFSDQTADKIGRMLGRMACRLIPSRRKIAFDNIRRTIGEDWSEEKIDNIVLKVFENIGCTFVEFARLKKTGHEGLRKIIVPEKIEYLEQAIKEGKGAILVTAHFGNWEMLPTWITGMGYQFEIIAGVQHNKLVDQLVTERREAMGVKVIKVKKSTLRDVFKALRRNVFVGILPDQHDPSREQILDFLGRKASVARGPALFAVKANCPIIPYLMRRERYDRHIIMAGEPIYPPHSGNDDNDVRDMTLKYLKFMEEIIKKYPEQWMWTHRRWKIIE